MLRKFALAGVLLLPAVAVAQPIQGLYIGGDVGANFAGTLQSSQATTKVYTDRGPVGIAALGWGFGNGLRAEIEGSYRSNGISGISTLRTNGQTLPLANVSGDEQTYAAMANIAYDIPVQPFGLPVQPYIGAGVGYARINMNNASGNGLGTFRVPGNNTVTSPDLVSFGSAGAFAYQAMAGLSLPISALPGLQATLEYRFFGTARADVPVNRVSTDGRLGQWRSAVEQYAQRLRNPGQRRADRLAVHLWCPHGPHRSRAGRCASPSGDARTLVPGVLRLG